jgi:hypothetical protein
MADKNHIIKKKVDSDQISFHKHASHRKTKISDANFQRDILNCTSKHDKLNLMYNQCHLGGWWAWGNYRQHCSSACKETNGLANGTAKQPTQMTFQSSRCRANMRLLLFCCNIDWRDNHSMPASGGPTRMTYLFQLFSTTECIPGGKK